MGKVLYMRKGEVHTAPQKPGILASTLAVGSTVKLLENGVAADYLVVHQGKPSSMYDDSCDGTWLLRKECLAAQAWDSGGSDQYAESSIHSYLNGTFLGQFDSTTQAAIRQVKIPYFKSNGYGSGVLMSGANGLSAKAFLLSGCEVNGSSYSGTMTQDGAHLSYFNVSNILTQRIAYQDGKAISWWFRSLYISRSRDTQRIYHVTSGGDCQETVSSYTHGVRPALILPSNAQFDTETLILKGV